MSGSKYQSWIKAGLAVLYTKEGIEPFVYDEIQQFQLKCLNDICYNNQLMSGTTCSMCCTENVVICPTNRICNARRGRCDFHRNAATQYNSAGCPNKICNNLKAEIQNVHRYYGPSYRNTDATQWCSNPWEVAKCFMPPDGYKDVTSAAETDFNGINSVVINYKGFQAKVNDNLGKNGNIFEKAREIGREVRHSANLEVDDTVLQQYFTDLQNLLSDPGYLSTNIDAQNAKQKLIQLQNDTLVIGKEEVREVLGDVAKAVQDKIRTEINEQRKETEKQKLDLLNAFQTSIDDLKNQEKVSSTELNNALSSALHRVEVKAKESIKALEAKKNEGVKELQEEADKLKKSLQTQEEIYSNLQEDEAIPDSEDLETIRVKAVIDKAWGMLVDHMAPDPIQDYARDFNLFTHRDARDIKEEKNTTEKNRSILNKVRMKGKVGYENFKVCLNKANQSKLVDLLECIEYGKDFSVLKTQIEDELVTDPLQQEFKDLKEDLIALYRKQYHTLPLSPLIEEQDTPLIKFYVMPDINTVEHQRSLGGGSESKIENKVETHRSPKSKPVTSLHDVFQRESKSCCEIYLTADAGFGKTAFSKRLVLTWCQAKKGIKSEQKHFKEEDIRAMNEFKFVFLLSLRECSEECDIDVMIMKQIIPRLANTSVTLSNLETILCKEKCLVILDGLDEWSHPTFACKQGPSDIPHRKARDCTILTTTRPWKLSVISLRSSQIEQKLEIVGLNKTSANGLKKSVISLLYGKPVITVKEHIECFNSAVKRKGLSVLETIPLLLMYLLCLWCDGIDLGRSKCELYCQIVELLLKRTFRKYPDMQHADKPPQSDIPQCFSEHMHCKNNYSLLKALAQLAYERLFNEHKENTLVFDQSVARMYLSQEYLDLCLFSGILTQSKPEQVKLTVEQSPKVSFSHKSVQEYFCALYMSCQNESDVKKIVLQNCSSVQNILDMSAVFVFISGMNAKVMSSISRELMPVISADKITSAYRSSTLDEDKYREPVRDIQNMYISCCKENPDNNDLKLLCQDIIIDSRCWEESYFTNVKQLAIHNKNNMQSIRIWTGYPGVDCSLHEVIDSCDLADPFNIPKIFYWGKCTEEELCRLLNGQVECVTVESDGVSSCSSELCKTLQNNSLLRAIYIWCFKMSHGVMEQFVNCLNRKSMAEIRLRNLYCNTHDRCPGLNLDLTQHSDLRTLVLDGVPVKQLSLPPEMVNIEYVELSNVTMAASTLHDLVKSAETRAHKVGVGIYDCTITPRTEFEHVRQYVRTSPNFRIIPDRDWREYNWYVLVFETIKC